MILSQKFHIYNYIKDKTDMKTQIRHKFLNMRNNLSADEAAAAENAVCENFFACGLEKIPSGQSIMLYSSFKNEIGTPLIINRLFESGIKVILPATIGNVIKIYEYCGSDSMKRDSFGILCPDESKCPQASPESIHTVIVPGVVFDRHGNRIGFGKGCYDRFLPKIPDAIKIGLCYDFQIAESLPFDENDVAMDFLLTESGLISCKK